MIAAMKRLLSLLFAALLCVLPLFTEGKSARAAENARYAVAPTRDVWFYAGESDSSRLFLLPYTYYVRVVYEGSEYSAVEYLADDAPFRKIYGYCKTAALQFVDFIPERPYLRRELTLTYELANPSGLGGGSLDRIERTAVYYGHTYDGGGLHFYVLSEGSFEYIAADKELEYELNTDYLTETSAEPEPPIEEESGLDTAGIIAICLVCLAAVAIAVFVLRGGRKGTGESERDF